MQKKKYDSRGNASSENDSYVILLSSKSLRALASVA
jgi:hypothetical protein